MEENHANIFVDSNFHFNRNQFETSGRIKRPRKKNSWMRLKSSAKN